MSFLRPLLLSVMLGASTIPLPALAGEPVTFVSREGRFAALFPATPQPERSGRESWAGRIDEGSFESEIDGLHLRVEYHDVPRLGLLVLSRDRLLTMARDSLLEDVEALEPRHERLSLRGHPGFALRYATRKRPDRLEEARLFLVGARIYVAFARVDEPGRQQEAAARFLASFDAWEPGEAVAAASASGSDSGL